MSRLLHRFNQISRGATALGFAAAIPLTALAAHDNMQDAKQTRSNPFANFFDSSSFHAVRGNSYPGAQAVSTPEPSETQPGDGSLLSLDTEKCLAEIALGVAVAGTIGRVMVHDVRMEREDEAIRTVPTVAENAPEARVIQLKVATEPFEVDKSA